MRTLFALALLAATLGRFRDWADSPQGYFMTKAERVAWSRLTTEGDAEQFVKAFLASRGLWDDAARAAVEGEIAERLDEAVSAAAAMPSARPGDVFENVYARPPERLQRQREELGRLTGG